MGSYENFARVYDELMDNVPYEEWAQFILNLLQDRKITAFNTKKINKNVPMHIIIP